MRVVLCLDKTAPPPEPIRVRPLDSSRPSIVAEVLDGALPFDLDGAKVTFRCDGAEVACSTSGSEVSFGMPRVTKTSPGHLRIERGDLVATTQDVMIEVIDFDQ